MSHERPELTGFHPFEHMENPQRAANVWAIELIEWLEHFKVDGEINDGRFPFVSDDYIEFTIAKSLFLFLLSKQDENEASAASQTAPAPTAATQGNDQLIA
jgi:hypothetical protein